MNALRRYYFLALLVPTFSVGAQQPADTIKISLQQAEQMFANNNLRLLAAKFNVSAARAAVLQAQLWNNPTITVGQNVYNQFTHRYFDLSSEGNTDVQVQQLILLAGKRDKQIRLAEINTRIAELSFEDVLRALTHELRTDFYDLFFLNQSQRFYDESIVAIRRTVTAVESVYTRRAILLSEVLRLKSLLFSFEKEQLDLLNQIAEKRESLRVLLNDSTASSGSISPQVDVQTLEALDLDKLSLQQALALAAEHRPDYQISKANVRFEETSLELQKALRIPDLTIGGQWSHAGSYIPDYYALSLSIDLPIFNRNQGNIAVSENTLESNRRMNEYTRRSIEKDVTTAYRRAVEINKLYKSFDKKYVAEYKQLVQGMIASYEKRNIGIIEFTDFFESYRTNMVQLNRLQNDRVDAMETLNYSVGSTLMSTQQ